MLLSRKSCCSTIRSFTTVKVFGKLEIVSCAFNLSVQRLSRHSPECACKLQTSQGYPVFKNNENRFSWAVVHLCHLTTSDVEVAGGSRLACTEQ